MRWRLPLIAAAALVGLATQGVPAPAVRAAEPPPDLASVQAFVPEAGPDIPFAIGKRASAVRLAALGFGSRAGLARRAWEIAAMLERHEARLSAIYRFGDLVLREGGFTVLPPVVAETRRAFRLDTRAGDTRAGDRAGTQAASAERVLRIVEPARLVSAAPGWGDWLRRSWAAAEPPAPVLFPRDGDEEARWRRLLAEGWAEGRALADDIFAADLDRLNRTFTGVVLWHRLHRAATVTAPAIEIDRAGVSGHESLMRIGAASARIARPARFELDAGRWAPPAGGAR
ncbi:MAG: type IV secretory system conjugative DNA transfer family protein [Rhodospirillales bacterium]|nr:type IV secretory system conjugative DNA transfer family protein [Rhodospirillales bacterium]